MTDIFKKGNVLNILFNKHAQLAPSRVQAHPDVLVSFMRDVLWNPQCNDPAGIAKRLKSSKAALYAKLDKYQSRTDTGR